MRSDVADVRGKWEVEGRVAGVISIPVEIGLHSGRNGGRHEARGETHFLRR